MPAERAATYLPRTHRPARPLEWLTRATAGCPVVPGVGTGHDLQLLASVEVDEAVTKLVGTAERTIGTWTQPAEALGSGLAIASLPLRGDRHALGSHDMRRPNAVQTRCRSCARARREIRRLRPDLAPRAHRPCPRLPRRTAQSDSPDGEVQRSLDPRPVRLAVDEAEGSRVAVAARCSAIPRTGTSPGSQRPRRRSLDEDQRDDRGRPATTSYSAQRVPNTWSAATPRRCAATGQSQRYDPVLG